MKEFASIMFANEAVRDAAYGYSSAAREKASEALRSSGNKGTRVTAARVLAQVGDVAKAKKLIDDLGQCLRQARALKLQHAVHLLNMSVMEVSDRSIDEPGKATVSTENRPRSAFRRES